MNKAAVQKALKNEEESFFQTRGFRFVSSRDAYARKFPLGEHRYCQRLVSSGSDWLVEPSIAIRFKQIEEIYHRTSGVPQSMQADSATLWVEIADLSGLRRSDCVPRITTLEDVPSASRQLESLFEKYGEPYLENNDEIADVDYLLNSDPQRPTIHCAPPRRSGYGLIVGFLLNRSDLDTLVREHRLRVAGIDNGFHLIWFDKLVEDLRNHYKA